MGRSVFIVVLATTYKLRIDLTSLKIEKTQENHDGRRGFGRYFAA